MAYLAPIHAPSSVRHALKLSFLAPAEECLVVAKANRLEFYAQTEDGLLLRHSRAVYGRVTMLAKLRPESAITDHLFVGTDRYMYFTLSWDGTTKKLKTERKFVDQADKISRDSQTGDRCAMDPSGSFIALELYEGIVNIIPIVKKQKKPSDPEIGTLLDPIPVRIKEMLVRSAAFVETRIKKNDKPKLALLFQDTERRVSLKLRELDYSPGLHSNEDPGDVELNPIEGLEEEIEPGASHLIPVPAPACGLLILAETSLMYYEHSSAERIRRPLPESTIFVAWERVDSQRFVLADEYGKLYLLMLEMDQYGKVLGWKLDVIGETSQASTLVYLENGKVFVGSHQGDSQVIAIKPQAIEIIQTFSNVAPILDFSIMDMGSRSADSQTVNEFSSGQARLVTGSGAYNDGSLRSMRSGVGLEDLGTLDEVKNVTDMFSVKSIAGKQYADTLIVSSINETRVLTFDTEGAVEEREDFKEFTLAESTLYAGNTIGDRLVQVTRSLVRLLDADSGMESAHWATPSGQSITAISANERWLVISVGGLSLITLDLTNDLTPTAQKQYDTENQIACVNVSPSGYPFVVVGFWHSSTISVLSLPGLADVHNEIFEGNDVSVPRSILLADMIEDQQPTLLLAMADGNVVTYSFNSETGSVNGRKSVILGSQEANLRALPRGNGLYNVFATCEHPSLIYGSEGRLVFSAITVENAAAVCSLDVEAYPASIAIAAEEGLRIALIDEERSTHVQGLHVGETVRRMAYSSELKAFGLGTIRRTLTNGEEKIESYFKLADEVLFTVLASFKLNKDELVESVMRCRLNDGSGSTAERFVVGTAYLDDDYADSIRGRILVLETTEDRAIKVVTERNVMGSCRCLAMLGDRIVAALIKTVVVYSFDFETPSQPFLTKRASYRAATAPIDLSVDENNSRITVADLMKSVSVLEYKRSNSAVSGQRDTLIEVARHSQTSWATAVAQVSSLEDDPAPLLDGTGKATPTIRFLETDAEGNLLLLNQNTDAVTSEDRKRLVVMAEFNLGETVNRIRTIGIAAGPDAAVIPRAFLATTEGSVYLFALIAPSKRDQLIRLQTEMAKYISSPGEVPFMQYRAFRSMVREEEEPVRFVDGELVEQFLNASDEIQGVIAKGIGADLEALRGMVEGLRRLR